MVWLLASFSVACRSIRFFGDQNAKFFPDQVQLARQLHGRNRLDHALHSAKAQTMADAFKDSIVLGGSGPNDTRPIRT